LRKDAVPVANEDCDARIRKWRDAFDAMHRRAMKAEARAASTSANVAQPLSIMRNAFRVTETEGNPDPEKQRFHMRFTFRSMEELHAADDQWRAFVSGSACSSANVAQGAEPSAYRTLLDSLGYPWLPCPICNGTEGCDHSYPERARAALAAPPVQTALTDDARDAIRRETLKEPVAQTELALTDDEVWQALKDIADLHSHPDDVVQAGRALLTAAQSASGDMK
jgi:hypothetical protein